MTMLRELVIAGVIVLLSLGISTRAPGAEAKAPTDAYGKTVLASKPLAYWRLADTGGQVARDSSGNDRLAIYDGDVTFGADGQRSEGFGGENASHTAVAFGSGSLKAALVDLKYKAAYSVELWFWQDERDAPSLLHPLLFVRSDPNAKGGPADLIGIGGVDGTTDDPQAAKSKG